MLIEKATIHKLPFWVISWNHQNPSSGSLIKAMAKSLRRLVHLVARQKGQWQWVNLERIAPFFVLMVVMGSIVEYKCLVLLRQMYRYGENWEVSVIYWSSRIIWVVGE